MVEIDPEKTRDFKTAYPSSISADTFKGGKQKTPYKKFLEFLI